jgi:Tfp pilus assembly protein PilF
VASGAGAAGSAAPLGSVAPLGSAASLGARSVALGCALSFALSSATLASCTAEDGAEQAGPRVTSGPVRAALPPAIEVTIAPLRAADAPKRTLEILGFATALVELGLDDLTRTVAVVENAAPSPGLRERLAPDERWRVELRVVDVAKDGATLELAACRPPEPCRAERLAYTGDPSPALAPWLAGVAERMARPANDAQRACWARPQSKDAYARLVTGRAAAMYYGLLPPLAASERNDRRTDPIERAVFLDPKQTIALWISGRRRFDADELVLARAAFTRASLADLERATFLADEAATVLAMDQADTAATLWVELMARLPDDHRLPVAAARALARAERADEAMEVLQRLPAAAQDDARVLALRVELLERELGDGAPDDVLLERWQRAAPRDPEPVRRRINAAVRAQAFAQALALVPELEARGAAEESRRYGLALAVSVGELSRAVELARQLGRAEVARAIELRATLASLDARRAAAPSAEGPSAARTDAGSDAGSADASRAPSAADAPAPDATERARLLSWLRADAEPLAELAVAERLAGLGAATDARVIVERVLRREPNAAEAHALAAQLAAALGDATALARHATALARLDPPLAARAWPGVAPGRLVATASVTDLPLPAPRAIEVVPSTRFAPAYGDFVAAEQEVRAAARAAEAVFEATARAQNRWAERRPLGAAPRGGAPASAPGDPCADAPTLARATVLGGALRDAVQGLRAAVGRLTRLAQSETLRPILLASDRRAVDAAVERARGLAVRYVELLAWHHAELAPIVRRCAPTLAPMPGMPGGPRLDDDAGAVAVLGVGGGLVCPAAAPADGRVVVVDDGRACWALDRCTCTPGTVAPGEVLGARVIATSTSTSLAPTAPLDALDP